MFRSTYYLFCYSYGFIRNFYYIPKLHHIDNDYYNIYLGKNTREISDYAITDKMFMCIFGIGAMPFFLPIAAYNDIRRFQYYFNKDTVNKEFYLEHQQILPYAFFSVRKHICLDKNI